MNNRQQVGLAGGGRRVALQLGSILQIFAMCVVSALLSLSLSMSRRECTSLKRVLSGQAERMWMEQTRTRTRHGKASSLPCSAPAPPLSPCLLLPCKLAYKPRFCHNLHIKLAQHFRRLPDWLTRPASPLLLAPATTSPLLPQTPRSSTAPLHRLLLLLLVTLGSRLGLI